MVVWLFEYLVIVDVCVYCNVVRCGVVNGISKGIFYVRMLKLGCDDWFGDGNFIYMRFFLK